jgi:hypothetical protein
LTEWWEKRSGTPRREHARSARSCGEAAPGREQLSDELRSLIVQETLAGTILAFERQLIPGILRIEGYARAVFQWTGRFPEEGIESYPTRRVPPGFS